jgi:hypothetical protein
MVAGDTSWQTLAGQIKHMPAMPRLSGIQKLIITGITAGFVKVGNAVTFLKAA